jgi:hypothetical protein
LKTWRFQANRNLFVLQLAKTESIKTVQRGFRTKYHTEPPKEKTIIEWYRKFEEMGCLCAAKRTGKPGSTPETGPRTRILYQESSKINTSRKPRIENVSRDCLFLTPEDV